MEILDLNNEEDTKTTDDMEPKKPEEKTKYSFIANDHRIKPFMFFAPGIL